MDFFVALVEAGVVLVAVVLRVERRISRLICRAGWNEEN